MITRIDTRGKEIQEVARMCKNEGILTTACVYKKPLADGCLGIVYLKDNPPRPVEFVLWDGRVCTPQPGVDLWLFPEGWGMPSLGTLRRKEWLNLGGESAEVVPF